jgi:uncharacterized membrane protein
LPREKIGRFLRAESAALLIDKASDSLQMLVARFVETDEIVILIRNALQILH